MKRLMFAASLSLGVTGCFGPGDPITLSEETAEAAETCFAAQSLVWGEDKAEGDPPSYSEFSDIIQYPMIAAAQTEPFSVDTVMTILSGAETAAEDIQSMDYEGAIPTCKTRFGLDDDGPTLPEDDSDAFLSCLSMTAFMAGVVQEGGVAAEGEVETTTAMLERLEAQMQNNPELLVKMIQGGGEDLMEASLKVAFAEGNPAGYIEKCNARFPAEKSE